MIATMLETVKLATEPKPIDNQSWDAFVADHPAGHLLQTQSWGKLKSSFGWRSEHVAIGDSTDQLRACALVLFRRVAGLTLAYVPRGPVTDWHDRPLTTALLLALAAACRRRGAVVLKLEPELPDTPANRLRLAHYGLRPSPQTVQPPSSLVLDISGPEEAVLARMKSKWRYNIRLAERKGVVVRTAAHHDLPAIHTLMAATGARDGFAVHSLDYYAAAFDLLAPEHATFLLAEYAGEPLAALVAARCGPTAIYLWGASSDRERNRMPNHALQWAAIRWARAQGATRYDLWGIPDALGQLAVGLRRDENEPVTPEQLPLDLDALPTHDLWGVYRFKQGFGGEIVRTVGAWDLPLNEWGYAAYQYGLRAQEVLQRVEGIGGRQLRTARQSRHQAQSSPVFGSLHVHSITTPADWQQTLAGLPNPHVLQSWEWGAVKAQTGWRAERYLLRDGGQPIAAFQFLWRQLAPGLPLRIAYLPKGPILDWANSDHVDATLAQIEQLARDRGCLFVKLDPDVREDATTGRLLLHALERRGWRYSPDQIQFKNTAFTDLRVGEGALLEQMKSKWRYNIRLAERRGIIVCEGGVDDLAAFYALYAETGRRDGFLTRPFGYYRTTWETFLAAQAEQVNPAGGALLLAHHRDEPQPVAGLFLLRYGDRVWYFNGASSDRHRRDMPNYLLQWEALRWAMAQGCAVYDWWGAPTDPTDSGDPLAGVWQFKQGFGATLQPHIGAWDYPVSPLGYRLYTEAMPCVLGWLRRGKDGAGAADTQPLA